ncbi:GNAT family N-acetyltransferase [Poritiphilus flavus]|uniref:GNAT family N-acetyltransferase n=1 Tax=Poritiphilus flavus TaxID=2697053 RepID=A0A6L9EGT8_9FLAO|nr:GNAT family N-acetyltransferase [Poritiphilus flavus]NAS13893.1 GNAT family N-acetyltransferase [Poritiphilus flavus]
MQKEIPYGIITDRLVIRCYRPADAELLLEAITNSLDNLKKWMPWAKTEPSSLEAKKELLQKFELDFLKNIDYNFGLFNRKQDVFIGSAGLHTRIAPNAREIGYWINSAYLNQGYATECTHALIKVGFEYHEIDHIEIHCDPNNAASQQIPKKLSFELAEILKNHSTTPEGKPRDTMIWKLTHERYQETSDSYPEIEVFYKEDLKGN